MTNTDKAIAIFRKTDDGDHLNPSDLTLVEAAVAGDLTARGQEAFERLLHGVMAGTHSLRHSTCLAPHVTKDANGTVRWKGIAVEHFSYPAERADAERAYAAQLSERCARLESIGLPVNARTAISPDCYEAPADSPWKDFLGLYYAVMTKGSEVLGLFRVGTSPAGVPGITAVAAQDGIAAVAQHDEAYEAFHHYQRQGYEAKTSASYERTSTLLASIGLSPEALREALALAPVC